MPNIHRTLLFVASIIVLSLLVFPVFAQVAPIIAPNCGFPSMVCTGGESFFGPAQSVESFVLVFIYIALGFVGLIAVIYIIYAGFKYISSRGDEEASASAKRQIIYALLGLFVAGTAFLIVNVVISRSATLLIIDIRDVINALLSLVAIVAVIYVIIGGVMYLISQGDQDKAARAKMQIIYALIGIAIVAISAVLVNFIISSI